MNHEILFKAKREDNNEWIEGDLIHDWDDLYIGGDFLDETGNPVYMKFEVIPETVSQYINESDSHGHELFWNDEIVVPELNNRRIVIDHKGVFSIIQNFIEQKTDFYYLKNKFDYPELLDKEVK